METVLPYVLILVGIVQIILLVVLMLRRQSTVSPQDAAQNAERLERSIAAARREITDEEARSLDRFSTALRQGQTEVFERQDKRLAELSTSLNASVKGLEERIAQNGAMQEKNAEALRTTVDAKLIQLRQDNEKSLGEIRQSVDEKLQKTLEDRISRSFKEVSSRLQEVYQGLGEMQTLASGVGDLKRVLSNVKTRGILGEIQLGAILEEILSPEQYEMNVATVAGSANRVEFAVRLPGDGDRTVYLPIDSKFPADAYLHLQDAIESCDAEQIKQQRALLSGRIKTFAKDIHDKYISPPDTTDFAIMFLPTEGLYAEVVQMGLVETLQQSYKINVAGPSTMAALLNALQTGFRTLAIQKRSGEVWKLLSAVRTEFDRFEIALQEAQKKIDSAGRGLDDLVGVRTRQIRRKLKSVEAMPQDAARALLSEENDE